VMPRRAEGGILVTSIREITFHSFLSANDVNLLCGWES